MDAGTIYLKLFLGAKAFESSELDSLAETMNISSLQSINASERYFITKANIAALSMGNKVLFGARYYGRLTEGQRLAVAAHEFGHVLGKDVEHRERRLVTPLAVVSTLLTIAVFLGTGSILVLECASALGFITAVAIAASAKAEHYLAHEMNCDRLAASFADGEALVGAIQIAESLQSARTTRAGSRGTGVKRHPSTKLRVDALLSRSGWS